jgi:hypothetical protein
MTKHSIRPPSKEPKRQRFQSDPSGASGDELPPVMAPISSRIVPAEEVRTTSVATAKSDTSSATSTSRASASDVGPPPRKTKAAANPAAALTKKGAGKKASTRTADEQATHLMSTRSRASRARSLRGVGGSGEKDTCVASGHPSKA